MISKVKGIILVVILSLASIMMPFSVYADTITTNNIEGINTVLLSKTQNLANTNSYWYVYEHTITLDSNYIGTINLNINLTYYSPSGSPQQISVATISNKSFYVNGNTIKINQIVTSDNYGNQGPIISSSYLLNSSNVIKYDDIESLQQVIDLLTDIYQNSEDIEGLSTDQLAELENIVANTSLANQYLQTISELRQFNFPIESLSVICSLYPYFSNNDLFEYSYWKYPVFYLEKGDYIVNKIFAVNEVDYFIFASSHNIAYLSTFNNIFTSSDGSLQFSDLEVLDKWFNGTTYNLVKMKITNTGSRSRKQITISSDISPATFIYIPFYLNSIDYKLISTDFALNFGLSNNLLDDIHLISQGTTQSNSAASNLEDEASEYSEIADDVIGVEEGLTSNFETEVNKIDLNTGLNGFGGNFMTSATWVRTQFDRLTENTPYGSLVVYGLTLGFVLLMLGKVLL